MFVFLLRCQSPVCTLSGSHIQTVLRLVTFNVSIYGFAENTFGQTKPGSEHAPTPEVNVLFFGCHIINTQCVTGSLVFLGVDVMFPHRTVFPFCG